LTRLIVSGEVIEGKAGQPEAVDYYISGKLLLPQDIASETQWMQEQWERLVGSVTRKYIEVVWDAWLQSRNPLNRTASFYAEWKEWFDYHFKDLVFDATDLVALDCF